MPHSAGAQLHERFHKVLAMFSHTQEPCYGDSEAVFLAAPIVPVSPVRSRFFLTSLRAKLMNFDLFFVLPFLYSDFCTASTPARPLPSPACMWLIDRIFSD